MQIHGLNKTTLLDYPGHLAATVFTGACNFRCPFCQNASLVLSPGTQPVFGEDEVFSFLEKRSGLLEGVCVTGGEPTLQPDLPDFLRRVRSFSLSVKLDTNGYCPEVLEALFAEGLLDYVAMDIKSSPEHYAQASGLAEDGSFDFSAVERSASLIRHSGIPYEFRTTAVRGLVNADDFLAIGKWLDGAERYFLQGYQDTGDLIAPEGLSAYTRQELEQIAELLTPHFKEVALRGID